MSSRFNKKLNNFVTRSEYPLAFTVDALVIPWTPFSQVYALPPVHRLPGMLHKIEGEFISVIPIAIDWLRRAQYTDIFRLLTDKPWPLSNRPDLLSQDPLFLPASQSLVLMEWMLMLQF